MAPPELPLRVALITGASSGIGEAAVRRLVRAGWKVGFTGRRADRLRALAQAIDPADRATLALPGDVAAAADRARWIDEVHARWGRLDALVNNAGYGQRGPLDLVPLEAIRRNFETNLFALVGLTQLAIPILRAQGGGRIVNVGSVAGRIARPLSSVYDATKHALNAISDGLRGELRPFGIHVVVIEPGFIATEFVDAADRASGGVLAAPGPYAPQLAGFRRSYERMRRLAGTPDEMAALIERACTARCPRPRYAGPAHAKVFLLVRRLLPDRLMDRLMAPKG